MGSETNVAPRVGAWIETGGNRSRSGQGNRVAPRVGAWIETHCDKHAAHLKASRPAWARGLKHVCTTIHGLIHVSRPAWARGLKLNIPFVINADLCRAPRGIVLSGS